MLESTNQKREIVELKEDELDLVTGGASTGGLTVSTFNPDQRGSANATQNNFAGFSGGYNQ